MFYAPLLLSKKSPLSKVWLAAHLERKLTKKDVYDTRIDEIVDTVLEPKMKIALRTIGHLLLGIVRIYSRKAKYLLADCNEAFVKIKMAFRPGAVDLPEQSSKGDPNAITLPEVLPEYDSTLPDFDEMDFENQLTSNISRREDITINEDFPGFTDGFSDFGGDDMDTTEFGRPDRSQKRTSSLHPPSINMPLDNSKGGFEAPIDDGGFGGQLDEALFAGSMEDVFGEGAAAVVPEQMDIDYGAHAGESDDEGGIGRPQQQISKITDGGDQTVLVTNEDEAFALEPVDVTAQAPHERQRMKRRRKLIVDEQKAISGEDMKAQLASAGDTTTALDLAPPTKKLMCWKETGTSDKMFNLANYEFNLSSKLLLKRYESRLVTNRVESETTSGEDQLQLEEIETISGRGSPDTTIDKGRDRELPAIVEEEERPLPSVSSAEGGWDMMDDVTDAAAGGTEAFAPPPEKKRRTTAKADTTAAAEEEEDGTDDASEEVQEERWNKRTQQQLNGLRRQFQQKKEYVSFMDSTKGNNRKQAAQKFYGLLALKKYQAIEVEQITPFGDILIRPGPEIDAQA